METKELLKKTIEDRVEAVKAQDEALIRHLDESIEQIKELMKIEEKSSGTPKLDEISSIDKLRLSVLAEKERGSVCVRCGALDYNKLKEVSATFNFSTAESIALLLRFFEERMNL